MPKLGVFPSKEADLNSYFQTVVPYLISNATRLLVSTQNQTLMTSGLTAWNAAFPASQNINLRTKTIVQSKDTARDNLMEVLRRIYDDIPASALTLQDRNTLNLSDRSASKTPSPVPTQKPIAQVDTSNRLTHTISFTNQDGTDAKPAGVRDCQIWHKIGDAPTSVSDLDFLATDTASPYLKQFDVADAGKMVHYWLRWENTRGETGPWSDVISATITG